MIGYLILCFVLASVAGGIAGAWRLNKSYKEYGYLDSDEWWIGLGYSVVAWVIVAFFWPMLIIGVPVGYFVWKKFFKKDEK